MSTFGGKIEEIPDISVDRFNEGNVYSTVYFLTHCHSDHMVGLADWKFQTYLNERPNVFLYTSSISMNILRYKFPFIQSKLKELSIDTPTLITFPNDPSKTLSVTSIPAGHCPGSVMFLFETDKTILYTGDYRVQLSDLKKFKAFYNLERLKKINKIYLDTTFFNRLFKTLPSRQDIVQILCKAIQEWTSQSEKHVVKLSTSATYGSEYLFAEITRNLGFPIHVRHEIYNLYKCVPELDDCVTLDACSTPIHTSCGPTYRDICRSNESHSVLTIKPSAQWWKGRDFSDGSYCERKDDLLRVCYSCHPSFEETKEFLTFLKPLEIEPCVVPSVFGTEKQLHSDINTVLNSYQQTNVLDIEEGTHQIVDFCGRRTPERVLDSSLDDILRSPSRNFKRKRMWLGDDKSAQNARSES